MGAWIEMFTNLILSEVVSVAPLVGAWIEIFKDITNKKYGHRSLPLWKRGLKLFGGGKKNCEIKSLPLWERGLK